MTSAGKALATERITAAGYRALEPFRGRADQTWLLECTTCGKQQRLRPTTKLKPCTHKKQQERKLPEVETEEKRARDALVSFRTRRLTTKNLRALEPHPGVMGVRWWVECKYCGRQWHMMEDNLRACPHKGTGDEGAPPPPVKPAPKKRVRKPKDARAFESFWVPLVVEWTVQDLPEGSNEWRTEIMRGWWDKATASEREQRLIEQRDHIVSTVARTMGVDIDPAGVMYTLGCEENAGPARPDYRVGAWVMPSCSAVARVRP
ncbi:hypothetical protein AB0465_40665 [Streptomyces griseoviridis]|uniref:hypothetical protein n=1 Tax=Streptomyces griseoviridis TaxID=45398 RepID=UPI00344BD370